MSRSREGGPPRKEIDEQPLAAGAEAPRAEAYEDAEIERPGEAAEAVRMESAEREAQGIRDTVGDIMDVMSQPNAADRLSALGETAKDKLWDRLEMLALLFGATAGGSGAFSFITEKLGTGKFQIGHVGLVMAGAALSAEIAFGITRYINGKRIKKKYGG